MFSFCLGISSFALILGFLVGASSSPAAGVAVTAGFGIVAAALAYMQSSTVGTSNKAPSGKMTKGSQARALSIATLNSVGRLLIVFSLAFAVGIAVGVRARTAQNSARAPVSFPWVATTPPTSSRQAVDWLIVQQHLIKIGYSNAQIAEIYRLELASNKGEPTIRVGETSISSLFSNQKIESTDVRWIASQPPPEDSIFKNPFSPSLPPSGPGKVNG
jgi:hypothetical protein